MIPRSASAVLRLKNGDQRIAVYGNLDLSRDKIGLEAARALKTLFTDVVRALEADKALPDILPAAPAPQLAPSSGLDLPTGGLAKS